MNMIYLSKKGFKELQKTIHDLEKQEKVLIAQLRDLGRVKSRDDALRRSDIMINLEHAQSRLTEAKQTLKHATLLPRKRDRLKVALGSVVDLIDQQGRMFRYTLVHSLEANPSDGRISIESPLGRHLLDRRVREFISFSSGAQLHTLQITRVS